MPAPQPKCLECGSAKLVKDESRGELVCGRCGTVVSRDEIDAAPEWRAFDALEQSERTRTDGPPVYARHESGVAERYRLLAKNRAQCYRLRKHGMRSAKRGERSDSYG